MRKLLLLLLLLLLFLVSRTIPLFPGKVAVFNQLKKPSGFYINNNHLYIVEFPLIYVYSLKDYRLIPGKDDLNQTDLTVNIYDSNFKKIKEVYRQKYYFQAGKPINGIYLAEVGR